jgi:putative transposase
MLNDALFGSLPHARAALEAWRLDYNTERPHPKLAWQTPTAYASTFNPHRDLAFCYANGSTPDPAAFGPPTADPTRSNELTIG